MKPIAYLLVAFIPLFSAAQKLTLTGSITGLPDSTKIVLTDLENPGAPVAETISAKEKFLLFSTLEAPSLLGLSVGDSIRTAVFLGNEKVELKGAMNQKPDEWKYRGSPIQNSFIEFQNTFVPRFAKLNELVQGLQNNAENGSSENELSATVSDIQQSVDAFISKNPASPVSTLAILSVMNITEDVAVLEKRMEKLQPAALNNVMGGQLKKALVDAKFHSVGSMALDFSQADTSGRQVSLSQFRGKYVLVDFWASWCGPCRKENHFLVKTFDKYRNKNFTVLGVSLDEEKEEWLKAIAKDELKWTQVSDLKGWENDVAVKYRVTAIPRNLLISPEGKIIGKNLHGDELEHRLEEALSKNN